MAINVRFPKLKKSYRASALDNQKLLIDRLEKLTTATKIKKAKPIIVERNVATHKSGGTSSFPKPKKKPTFAL